MDHSMDFSVTMGTQRTGFSNLQITDGQVRDAVDRERGHRESMKAGGVRLLLPMRRRAGWHEQNRVEIQRALRSHGRFHVAHVNRIERAAQNADARTVSHSVGHLFRPGMLVCRVDAAIARPCHFTPDRVEQWSKSLPGGC